MVTHSSILAWKIPWTEADTTECGAHSTPAHYYYLIAYLKKFIT